MKEEKTISSVGEFELIRSCFSSSVPSDVTGITVGLGDDGAVLDVPRTQELVVSTDTLVEGIHFSSDDDPYLLGRKALRVNLSDLAAMGAQPRWYLLSLSLPPSTPLSWVTEFSRGLKEDGERYKVALTGGDTTGSKGCRIMTITMMGYLGKGRALCRSGLQLGDRLFVTGTLGDATLGLAHHLGRMTLSDSEDAIYLMQRHQLPEPRIAFGMGLIDAALAHGAIDLSDGLVADLRHLCTASKVGAEVDVEKIPLSHAARRQLEAHDGDLLTQILTGGEDYELLFAVSPGCLGAVANLADQMGLAITEIGVVTAGSSVNFNLNGTPMRLGSGGWTHF
ncbi:MAG: thiamine-phosphate kinase [Magnetococcales bacterium]|nr:thiamine-phosphate kinase [Magnetococcales bacterium]